MNSKPVCDLPDLKQFLQNRERYPASELQRYAGQYVAWSLDATRIIASASDEQQLQDRLLELGVDPCQVVGSYVDPLEQVELTINRLYAGT